MNKLYKSSIKGSLFLEGVFKNDFSSIEDLFQDRILENEQKKTIVIYDKIPSIYDSTEPWPTECNLHCNYCTCKFDNSPWFIPRSLDTSYVKIEGETIKKYTSITQGVFCSVNCAATYIAYDITSIAERLDKLGMLKILYQYLENHEINNIPLSPSYLTIDKYGGDKTIVEYRECIVKSMESIGIVNTEKECIINFDKYDTEDDMDKYMLAAFKEQ